MSIISKPFFNYFFMDEIYASLFPIIKRSSTYTTIYTPFFPTFLTNKTTSSRLKCLKLIFKRRLVSFHTMHEVISLHHIDTWWDFIPYVLEPSQQIILVETCKHSLSNLHLEKLSSHPCDESSTSLCFQIQEQMVAQFFMGEKLSLLSMHSFCAYSFTTSLTLFFSSHPSKLYLFL